MAAISIASTRAARMSGVEARCFDMLSSTAPSYGVLLVACGGVCAPRIVQGVLEAGICTVAISFASAGRSLTILVLCHHFAVDVLEQVVAKSWCPKMKILSKVAVLSRHLGRQKEIGSKA